MSKRREELLKEPLVLDDDLRRRLLEVLLTPPQPRKMTYEEFLAWADEDTLAEWVNGEIIMATPASKQHQDVVGFLYEVLQSYVRTRRLGTVIQAPFQMKLQQGREPDLMFIRQENQSRLRETYVDGPADLVVEVVSSESAGRDRGEKFYEYARGGVSEYWLIDPQVKWAEFYQLEGDHYRIAFSGGEGRYQARVVPGFWLRVEWLWQEPPPHPLRALGEIAGLDSELVERFLQALEDKMLSGL